MLDWSLLRFSTYGSGKVGKLNKIGSQIYSPQMQLLPIVADDLNAAIASAFAAQVQNYEATKGKPIIVTGLCK